MHVILFQFRLAGRPAWWSPPRRRGPPRWARGGGPAQRTGCSHRSFLITPSLSYRSGRGANMHQSASHNIPFLTRKKQVCPCSEDIKCPMFSSEQELSMTGLVSPRTELLVSKELESRKFIHNRWEYLSFKAFRVNWQPGLRLRPSRRFLSRPEKRKVLIIFFFFLFASGVGFPLYHEIFYEIFYFISQWSCSVIIQYIQYKAVLKNHLKWCKRL